MTDRELLEKAAKAAGLYENWPEPYYGVQWNGDGLWCFGNGRGVLWNPLTDDGDALRLACDLGLVVDCSRPSAGRPFYTQRFEQDDYTDQRAATRRAVVRAAAAIGEAMP